MLELGLESLIAYLLGTLLGSLILGRVRGVDIRSMGSGNAGATNALRTQGKAFGLFVLVFDIGKGVAAVLWVPALGLAGVGPGPVVPHAWVVLACGLAVILGHVYPVWYGFRGGKGVATVVGVVGALDPRLLIPLLACWLVVLLLTGYVGLASMVAGVGLIAAVYWLEPGNTPLHVFCVLVTALVIFTHRGGKGVATVVGVVGALDPRLLIPLLACWLAVLLLTGYVGLASMVAGVGLIAAVYWLEPGNTPLHVFCVLVTALVIFTHRGNISRMAAGTEHRARRLWLFRSRAA